MTQPSTTADLILHRGLFTTLAHAHPAAPGCFPTPRAGFAARLV